MFNALYYLEGGLSVERIKNATPEESNIISFVLANPPSMFCGAFNLNRIEEVFAKYREEISFLDKIKIVIEQNIIESETL